MTALEYPFITSVLPEAEGSGYLIEYPDLSLHTRLTQRAEHEGVSLNALVISLLAEGLGRKDAFSSEQELQP